jgi:hypothetical protein
MSPCSYLSDSSLRLLTDETCASLSPLDTLSAADGMAECGRPIPMNQAATHPRGTETPLRRATLDDLASVARLHRLAFFHAMPHMPVLHMPEEDLAFYARDAGSNCGDELAAELLKLGANPECPQRLTPRPPRSFPLPPGQSARHLSHHEQALGSATVEIGAAHSPHDD